MKEVLITSSAVIAVIMLLRWFLRGKVSQRLIYGVWLLVVLRLLIPVQIGQLSFSVLSAAKPVTQTITEISDKQVAGVTHQDSYRQVLQEYIEEDQTVFTPEIQDRIQLEITNETPKEEIAVMIDKVYSEQEVFIPEAQPQVQEKVEATADPITLGQILTGIWLVGIAIMALWFICANLIFLRRAKKGSAEAEFEGVHVRISPNIPTPCVVGLFRPKIYLTPACEKNEQTRAHVLAHEKAHLRHGDHIWAFVRCLCLCVYWFDPLVWIAAAQSRRDCELACDESALKQLGDAERIAYGKTLLDIVSQSVTPSHLLQTATAMNESKKQLTERVNYIVKKPRNILIAAICMALVAAITAGCAFLGASPTEPAGPTAPQSQTTGPSTPTDPTVPSDPTGPDQEPPELVYTDLLTATTKIQRFTRYMAVGVCCEFELVYEDMSAHLSESQKQNYYEQQYRITCCDSAESVRAYIDGTMSKDLQIRGYPDDRLFTDGEGQLYLIIEPSGYVDYRDVTISESDGRLYAKAGAYDEDGWFADAYFTIENQIITQFARTDLDGIPSYVEDLFFPVPVSTIFDSADSWYRRALTSDYTAPKDANIARFFNLGFSDEPSITDAEWEQLKNVPGLERNNRLHRLPAKRMDAVLTMVFGLTLSQMNGIGMDKLTYLESTDCYYLMGDGQSQPEFGFPTAINTGANRYMNGSAQWFMVIRSNKTGHHITQNSTSYTHQVMQTTELAKEHLGMTRLEFLYASTLMLQRKMEAEGWSEEDRESVCWNAYSIKNRSLYLEDGVLMMQAQYSSLADPEAPLYKTIYIPYKTPILPTNFKDDCYYWLIDMSNHTDGYVADAYATLLLECAVLNPDQFLHILSEFNKDTIDICWGQLYYGVISLEDADALNKMLDHLSTRTDLTDREQQTLNRLCEAPLWYHYTDFLDPPTN